MKHFRKTIFSVVLRKVWKAKHIMSKPNKTKFQSQTNNKDCFHYFKWHNYLGKDQATVRRKGVGFGNRELAGASGEEKEISCLVSKFDCIPPQSSCIDSQHLAM